VKSAVHVFLGDGDDEAEIGFDQVFFGALSFGFAVTDDGKAVLEFGKGGAGNGFALFDFALELAEAELLGGVGTDFEALDFAIEVADFVYGAFDLAGEFLPLDEAKGSAADGEGGFDLGAVEFGAEAFAGRSTASSARTRCRCTASRPSPRR